MIKNKKVFSILLIAVFLFPIVSFSAGLIPCGGTGEPKCDFSQLMILVKNFINFLLFDLAMPLAAIAFAYAGYLYMSSGGDTKNTTKAKNIFKDVLFGFVLALSAWLIVTAILTGFGLKDGFSFLK
ncbi:MAG: hypothetical protein WDK96_03100 [Candidatus Paceibacterota bacterium]|jgi:hypothetical protein